VWRGRGGGRGEALFCHLCVAALVDQSLPLLLSPTTTPRAQRKHLGPDPTARSFPKKLVLAVPLHCTPPCVMHPHADEEGNVMEAFRAAVLRVSEWDALSGVRMGAPAAGLHVQGEL